MTKSLYQQAQQSKDAAAAYACVALCGMTVEQANAATVHLDSEYIQTKNGDVFPLSRQAKALLTDVNMANVNVDAGWRQLDITVEEAHQALAQALWATSEDAKFLYEMVAVPDLPALPLDLTYPLSIVDRLTPQDHQQFQRSQAAMQAAADWLLDEPTTDVPLWEKLLDGKLIFLVVSTGVSGLNLLHNLVMGRLLSPVEYGQLTFFITVLLITGLIPTAMQTVAARYSAAYTARDENNLLAQLHRLGVSVGWQSGVGLAVLIMILSPLLADIFSIRDAWLFLPVVLSIPFFFATGTERGMLQGRERYYWLSAAYFAEGIVRLGVGVLLAWLLLDANRALDGAVWALTQSLLLTWVIAWAALRDKTKIVAVDTAIDDEQHQWIQLLGFTVMALLGQALITNSDFILVKTFFSSTDAGLYAAISVIGRIVYFGTLPLTVLIVPLIARKQALGESTKTLFALLMGSGAVLCGGLFVASALFAPQIVQLFYGTDYLDAAYLLPMYTIAAALFVMTNLLVTYRVALGKGSETWMPLLAGLAQIGGVMIFHDSLMQVITVQITIMSVLFVSVGWRVLADTSTTGSVDGVPESAI